MLYGEYKHTIDKKGRMFIPAKLRDDLGSSFVLCRGIDGNRCLCIYSETEWKQLDEKIRQLPTVKSSRLQRFLYAGAVKSECDAQGRVLIPQNLREYADLGDEAYVLGMSARLEIWNRERWEAESILDTPESIGEITAGLEL